MRRREEESKRTEGVKREQAEREETCREWTAAYEHQGRCHAWIRRSPALLALTEIPSPGPSDALMTPSRLAHNHPVDLYCCRERPDTSRHCQPGTPQGHLCPWCMDPNRTGGRGMKRNMLLWWTLVLFSQGFVSRDVRGELPFISGNNAAMLVNWWVWGHGEVRTGDYRTEMEVFLKSKVRILKAFNKLNCRCSKCYLLSESGSYLRDDVAVWDGRSHVRSLQKNTRTYLLFRVLKWDSCLRLDVLIKDWHNHNCPVY